MISSLPFRPARLLGRSALATCGLIAVFACGAALAAAPAVVVSSPVGSSALHLRTHNVKAALRLTVTPVAASSTRKAGVTVSVSGTLTLAHKGQLSIRRCLNSRCTKWAKHGPAHGFSHGSHLFALHFTLAQTVAVRMRLTSGRFHHVTKLKVPNLTSITSIPAPAPTAAPTVPVFTITTSAGLVPAFDPAIPDYTVPCGTSGSVTVAATVLPGQTLSINGGPAQTGAVSQSIPLQVDQAFTFVLTTSAGATTYYGRCTPADFPTWSVSHTGTPQVQWIALTPPGGNPISIAGGLYAVITDSYGVPVWWMRAPAGENTLNASVLPDGDVAYWTANGLGDGEEGEYNIVNLDGLSPLPSGQPDVVTAATSDGLGEVGANLHDFIQLSNGNYMLIAPVPHPADLTPYGINNTAATVISPTIQEVTPSGQLVWEWNSANHIGLDETDWAWGATYPSTWNGPTAYDIVHMNSIQVLDDGSCLATQSCDIVFSARHLDAIYEINMATGNVIWKLGGTNLPGKSLTFVGDPYGNFNGQHDAQILPDGTLTVHDNGSQAGRPPRTAHYAINTTTMTATYLGGVTDPRVGYSNCCGGAALLPGGDWLVDWGANPLVTELSPTGVPVLSLYLSGYSTYRAYAVPDSTLINRSTLLAGMDAQFAATQSQTNARRAFPSAFSPSW